MTLRPGRVVLLTLASALLVAPGRAAAPPERLTAEIARATVAAVLPDVEEIRGLRFKRAVPVEAVNDTQARDYAERRLLRFVTPAQIAGEQAAFALLGLLPQKTEVMREYLDVLGEQAGGFYDPSSKSFFLLSDMPPTLAPVLVAHELTHALEDQYFDLDARLTGALADDDLVFARSAVHEGSATLVMTLYIARLLREGSLRPDDLQALADSEAGQAAKLSSLPSILRRPLLGAYILGAAFLSRGGPASLTTHGFPRDDIDRVYRDGPRSSEQILHPEKYWDPGSRDEPRSIALGDAGRALGEDWKLQAGGVLGELIIGLLVGADTPGGRMDEPMAEPADWTNAAAAGWGGDRWELWGRDGQAVVLLSTAWDTPGDAREFAAALPGGRSRLAWKRSGDRVAVVAGEAGNLTRRILNHLLKTAD